MLAFQHFESNLPWQQNKLFSNLKYKHLFVIIGCWWVLGNIFFNEIRDRDIMTTDEETLIAEVKEDSEIDPDKLEQIDEEWVLPYNDEDSLSYYWHQQLMDEVTPERIDIPNTPPKEYQQEEKRKMIVKNVRRIFVVFFILIFFSNLNFH